MRVLIVDDSVVFRSQIKSALENVAHIEVVGTANNGRIALQKLEQGSVDLVVLDMEMPELDGLATIKEIRKAKFKVDVIVFSSHTTRGSEAPLEALNAGAQDFVAKPSGDDVNYQSAATKIRADLVPKILQFLPKAGVANKTPAAIAQENTASFEKKDLATFHPGVIVIGSSTGGPPALEKLFAGVASPLCLPVLIAQHMPPVFTASLAKRLKELTGIEAAEAQDGEPIRLNKIYVAPGNFHMSVASRAGTAVIKLDQSPPRNSVRPAVDVLFESVAEHYGAKACGMILTGMGQDGMLGAVAIKKKSGAVLIQDQASCVVFGMPGAVYQVGAFDLMAGPEILNVWLKKFAV